MTSGKASSADVTLDLLSIQSNALKALHDYDQYLRHAESVDAAEVAYFVRQIMEEDSARAAHCQGLLRKLSGPDNGEPERRSA
jgi:hypothetical protein